jgi:putative nucleotidyltransferase with HDIG domain
MQRPPGSPGPRTAAASAPSPGRGTSAPVIPRRPGATGINSAPRPGAFERGGETKASAAMGAPAPESAANDHGAATLARAARMKRRAAQTAKALRGMLELRMRGGELTLPVLPSVVNRLNAELNNPNSNLQRASAIIATDSGMTAKVIQVANSPAYRGSSQFNTVNEAVVRLGVRTTNSIVMAVCQKGIYKSGTASDELMEDLFSHGLATASFARLLAQVLKYRMPEEAFLTGLLHDIASPLILRLLGDIMQANKAVGYSEWECLAVIKELHADVGASVLRKWGLGNDVLYVVEHHERLSHKDEPFALVNNITFLANVIAKHSGFGLIDEVDIEAQEAAGAAALGLDASALAHVKQVGSERAEHDIAVLTGL